MIFTDRERLQFAEDRRGGRYNNLANAVATRGLENPQSPQEVRFGIRERVGKRACIADRSRQVKYDPRLFRRSRNRREIANIALDEIDRLAMAQAGGQVIEHGHLMALLYQELDNI